MVEKPHKTAPGAPEVPKELIKQLGPDLEEPAAKQPPAMPSDKVNVPAAEEASLLEDEQTDEAVEDIIRNESNELLESQDEAAQALLPTPKKKHWWQKKWFRWFLVLIFLAAAGLMLYPTTRYWILNTAGVRASASVVVKDHTTGQPLKNVQVSIGGAQVSTNSEGTAKIDNIQLGPQKLNLERIAFAPIEKDITIGWGSNPLGIFEMDAVGAQYTVIVRDYLSGQPIEGAEASDAQAAALSDAAGKLVLTLPKSDGSDVVVTVSGKDYRSEQITLKAAITNDAVLVPAAKEVYVSRESGRYDLYTIDIDGKNKKTLLAGTGLESANITLAVSPDNARVAMVSTRDNMRTADGRLLNTLTLVNVENGTTTTLDRAEQIQIMDWIGNRIVYHMIANVATNAADRQRIISYDYKADSRAQLASANQLPSAASALGMVYFAADSNYYKINPDGTAKQAILDKATTVTYRSAYDALHVQTSEGWYGINLKNGSASKEDGPASYANRTYMTNVLNQQSLWLDKNALQLYAVADNKSTNLHSQDGLTYPVRWISDTAAIFRVANGQEIADYAISTKGGAARKITPVVSTYGVRPAF